MTNQRPTDFRNDLFLDKPKGCDFFCNSDDWTDMKMDEWSAEDLHALQGAVARSHDTS